MRGVGMIRIGTVAKLLAVDATTLRRYEKAGKIPQAQRTALGFRVYTEEEIEKIRKAIAEIARERA